MSLLTLSQSVSHKWFHKWLNHKKKLSLRCPLPTFGSFSFFQAFLWLGVDKVLQKQTKSYKNELRHSFQHCILIPGKCPRKTPFQHTVPSWNRVNVSWSATIGEGDCPLAPCPYGPKAGMLCWLGNDHWQNGKPQFFFLVINFSFLFGFFREIKTRRRNSALLGC